MYILNKTTKPQKISMSLENCLFTQLDRTYLESGVIISQLLYELLVGTAEGLKIWWTSCNMAGKTCTLSVEIKLTNLTKSRRTYALPFCSPSVSAVPVLKVSPFSSSLIQNIQHKHSLTTQGNYFRLEESLFTVSPNPQINTSVINK